MNLANVGNEAEDWCSKNNEYLSCLSCWEHGGFSEDQEQKENSLEARSCPRAESTSGTTETLAWVAVRTERGSLPYRRQSVRVGTGITGMDFPQFISYIFILMLE